jgi:hypothetical protein
MNADDKPWFAPQVPWAFWGRPSRKRMLNNGTAPQNTLAPNERHFGFAVWSGVGLTVGANASGLKAGSYPATVGNVLNLSAAAIASGPAFNRLGRPNQ